MFTSKYMDSTLSLSVVIVESVKTIHLIKAECIYIEDILAFQKDEKGASIRYILAVCGLGKLN